MAKTLSARSSLACTAVCFRTMAGENWTQTARELRSCLKRWKRCKMLVPPKRRLPSSLMAVSAVMPDIFKADSDLLSVSAERV